MSRAMTSIESAALAGMPADPLLGIYPHFVVSGMLERVLDSPAEMSADARAAKAWHFRASASSGGLRDGTRGPPAALIGQGRLGLLSDGLIRRMGWPGFVVRVLVSKAAATRALDDEARSAALAAGAALAAAVLVDMGDGTHSGLVSVLDGAWAISERLLAAASAEAANPQAVNSPSSASASPMAAVIAEAAAAADRLPSQGRPVDKPVAGPSSRWRRRRAGSHGSTTRATEPTSASHPGPGALKARPLPAVLEGALAKLLLGPYAKQRARSASLQEATGQTNARSATAARSCPEAGGSLNMLAVYRASVALVGAAAALVAIRGASRRLTMVAVGESVLAWAIGAVSTHEVTSTPCLANQAVGDVPDPMFQPKAAPLDVMRVWPAGVAATWPRPTPGCRRYRVPMAPMLAGVAAAIEHRWPGEPPSAPPKTPRSGPLAPGAASAWGKAKPVPASSPSTPMEVAEADAAVHASLRLALARRDATSPKQGKDPGRRSTPLADILAELRANPVRGVSAPANWPPLASHRASLAVDIPASFCRYLEALGDLDITRWAVQDGEAAAPPLTGVFHWSGSAPRAWYATPGSSAPSQFVASADGRKARSRIVTLADLRQLISALVDEHPALEWPWRHDARLRSYYVTVAVVFIVSKASGPHARWVTTAQLRAMGLEELLATVRQMDLEGMVPFDPRYVLAHVLRFEALDTDGDGLLTMHDLLFRPRTTQAPQTHWAAEPRPGTPLGADAPPCPTSPTRPAASPPVTRTQWGDATRLSTTAGGFSSVRARARARRQQQSGPERSSPEPEALRTPIRLADRNDDGKVPPSWHDESADLDDLPLVNADLEPSPPSAEPEPQWAGAADEDRRTWTVQSLREGSLRPCDDDAAVSRGGAAPPALFAGTPRPAGAAQPDPSLPRGRPSVGVPSPRGWARSTASRVIAAAGPVTPPPERSSRRVDTPASSSTTRSKRRYRAVASRPTDLLHAAGVTCQSVPITYEETPFGPACIVPLFVLQRIMMSPGHMLPASGCPGVFNFEDFVRFSLAQADRMRTTSARYWLRAIDLDDDGAVGPGDLERVHRERRVEAYLRYGSAWAERLEPGPWAKLPVEAFLRSVRVLLRGAGRQGGPAGTPPRRGGGSEDPVRITPALLSRRGCDQSERGWNLFTAVLAVDACGNLGRALRFLHRREEAAAARAAGYVSPRVDQLSQTPPHDVGERRAVSAFLERWERSVSAGGRPSVAAAGLRRRPMPRSASAEVAGLSDDDDGRSRAGGGASKAEGRGRQPPVTASPRASLRPSTTTPSSARGRLPSAGRGRGAAPRGRRPSGRRRPSNLAPRVARQTTLSALHDAESTVQWHEQQQRGAARSPSPLAEVLPPVAAGAPDPPSEAIAELDTALGSLMAGWSQTDSQIGDVGSYSSPTAAQLEAMTRRERANGGAPESSPLARAANAAAAADGSDPAFAAQLPSASGLLLPPSAPQPASSSGGDSLRAVPVPQPEGQPSLVTVAASAAPSILLPASLGSFASLARAGSAGSFAAVIAASSGSSPSMARSTASAFSASLRTGTPSPAVSGRSPLSAGVVSITADRRKLPVVDAQPTIMETDELSSARRRSSAE